MRVWSLALIACFVFYLGAVRTNWVGAEELSPEEVAALKDLLKTKGTTPEGQLTTEEVTTLKEIVKTRKGGEEITVTEKVQELEVPHKAKAEPLSDDEVTGIREFMTVFKGIKFSGFVESFYQYNTARPGDGNAVAGTSGRRGSTPTFFRPNFLEIRGFDREDNSFTLNNIELHLYKEPTEDSPIGFRITTLYGEMAQRLTFVPTDNRVDGGNNTMFTVGEGYTWWKIPLGKGLDFKFGKFATWIGAEVWEAQWNPNWSRSLLYNNAIPFTHTGLSLGYPVTDSLYFTLFLVNGWDTFVDNNKSKTVGTQTKYTIPDMPILHNAFAILNTSHGPEQSGKFKSSALDITGDGIPDVGAISGGSESNWRNFFDVIFQFDPMPWLRSNSNFDYGIEDYPKGMAGGFGTLTFVGDNRTHRQWWGVAQIFQFFPQNRINFALRGEYFWDREGARNAVPLAIFNPGGTFPPHTGIGVAIAEVTGTLNIKIRDKLWIRPEVRFDKITSASGTVGNPGDMDLFSNKNNNTTFATAFTYEF